MTTTKSPPAKLREQAGKLAAALKGSAGSERFITDMGTFVASGSETVTFGIVMDDKVIHITLSWDLIRAASEAELAEYIISEMRKGP